LFLYFFAREKFSYCLGFISMGDMSVTISESSPNPSKKKIVHVSVVEITNVQHWMLSVVFERYVMNRYGSYNVAKGGLKYIHYDLTNPFGYLTIT
jgi:hypothetical protein